MADIAIEKRLTPSGVKKWCIGICSSIQPNTNNTRIFYKNYWLPPKPYTVNFAMLDYGLGKDGRTYYWFGISKRFRILHFLGWYKTKNWRVEVDREIIR